MALQPRDRFFAQLDSKARGSFELSAAQMFASLPADMQYNILRNYIAGKIRDVSAYVCSQWCCRCKAELAEVKAAQEEEQKQAEREVRAASLASEREATRRAFVASAKQDFKASFPTLGAEPAAACVIARNSVWWKVPRAVVEKVKTEPHAEVEMVETESEPRAAVEMVRTEADASQVPNSHAKDCMEEEVRPTAPRTLKFLLGKRVAASWYGEVHIGVVRCIDACTVQILWEEEYSQSDIRFEDVLSLAENQ